MAPRLIVGVFLGLLALPLAQAIHPLIATAPIDEKRVPRPFPRVSEFCDRTDDALASKLNGWFDDRIGFRDFMIRLKNQIDYSVFGTSAKVLIGRDGWLYHRGTLDAKVETERASQIKLREIEGFFDWLQAYAADRDMLLVVVSYPDKATIYPNEMGPSFPTFREPRKYELVRAYLRNKPGLLYIDAEPILREESRRHRVFYQTDVHTAFFGNIAMTHAVVDRIADALGRSDVYWNEHFSTRRYPFTIGSESHFIPLFTPLGEEIDAAIDQYELFRDTADTLWIAPTEKVHVPGIGEQPVFDWLVRAPPGKEAGRLPPAALFGNSFSDSYFGLGIQRYFVEIRRARTEIRGIQTGRGNRLLPYLATMPAHVKILIYQYFEPLLLADLPDYLDHGARSTVE